MQWLAQTSVARPVFATVLILSMTVLGLFAIPQLGVERYPNIDIPYVTVVTTVPGASPQEIEADVTDVIERQVNTVPGLESITSTSFEGMSLVVLLFQMEKNGDVAAQEVRAKVDLALPELPREAERPVVAKFRTDDIPVFGFALISPDAGIRELTEYAKHTLRPQLQGIRGVGDVALVGQRERQIQVLAEPSRMKSFGLTVVDLQRMLAAQNAQIPSGSLERGRRRLSVRTLGRAPSVSDLGAVVVQSQGGRQVRVRDVARVVDGEKDGDTRANVNDTPAVVLNVRKQSGENTVAVAQAVRERLRAILPTLPAGYRVEVVRDESVFIVESLRDVVHHLVLGSILAALVVLVFLKDWRSTIIAAIAIPTSIISTFAVMRTQGFSLNVLTLLALTLVVGIVIDDAILVLENIYRHIAVKRLSPHQAAIEATREIGLAVLATTLSLVAVFLPVGLISGLVGRFLGSFGITMSAAILISMLVAFSLTPMLASRWLRPKPEPEPGEGKSRFRRVEGLYARLVAWSLHHRAAVVAVALVALAATVPLAMVANKTFVPSEDQSQFLVTVRTPEGTSVPETERILSGIARDVRALPEVTTTVVTAGEMSPNKGSVLVRMPPIAERRTRTNQFDLMEKVRGDILPRFSRDLTVSVIPVDPFGNTEASVQYILTGPDRAVLTAAAGRIAAGVAGMPEVSSATTNAYAGNPELEVTIDRERAADQGVIVADIATTLRALVAGDKVSRYSEGGRQYDIVLRADRDARDRDASLKAFTVPSTSGVLPLSDVVRLSEGEGPSQVSRYNLQKEIRVLVNPRPGASLETIQGRMEALLAEQRLPEAYRATWEGDSKEFERTFTSFGMAFLLSLIFMYLVLAAQFESWLHPVTILLSLPLCVPFALIPLVLTGDSLNLFSLLGVLVLFGIVKKNSILQVDHALQLMRGGLERDVALVQASRDRLRPILMTTVAFVAGMIPLALSQGAGAATNRTIAVTVIGGQTLSLLLTLVATPVMFSLMDDVTAWMGRVGNRLLGRWAVLPALVLVAGLVATASPVGAEDAAGGMLPAVPQRILSIEEAVRVALAHNPDAQIAVVRQGRARAGTGLAQAAARPQVYCSFSFTRFSSASALGSTSLTTSGLPGTGSSGVAIQPTSTTSGSLVREVPPSPSSEGRAGGTRAAGGRATATAREEAVTTGVATTSSSDTGSSSTGSTVDTNVSVLQVGVTLPVDITGVLRLGVRLARLDEAIMAQEAERVRQVLALEVRTACHGLLRAQALSEVQEASLRRAQEQLRVTQLRRDEGLLPQYDVLRSRTEERAARQAAIAARNQVRVARSSLLPLLGISLDTEVTLPQEPAPPVVASVELDRTMLTVRALTQRPESRAALLGVQRSRGGIRYARRTLDPSLGVGVTASYLPTPILSGYDSQRVMGTAGLVLSIPVEDGGATRAAVAAARLEAREAELRLRQASQAIAAEVDQAIVGVMDARERLAVADEAIQEARAALDIARLRFSSGIGVQLEVLDAQAALTRAEASVAESRCDHGVALARLARAVGDPVEAAR